MLSNVHEREIDAPLARLSPLLERVGGPDDELWPSPAWWPMTLDRPLAVGASGGHGGIRYRVSEHDRGRRVRFELHPGTGLLGHHELSLEALGPSRTRVRHVLVCRLRGAMRLVGPLLLVPLHDALVEDLLDDAERAATGTVRRPARWSPWVRLWQPLTERVRARAVPPPAGAALAADVRERWAHPDLVDAWTVPLWRGLPTDPQPWADAVFRDPPRWVVGLLALRQALVPFVGIRPGSAASFATLAGTGEEVLLGEDAGHLDFRASVHVGADAVTLTTVARARNLRGRAYLALVRRLHPPVVRAMLARAHRRLARDAARGLAGASAAR
jgi:hypothetical protein